MADQADAAPDYSGEWNPTEALKNLTLEKAFSDNKPEEVARKLFKDNLPLAVMAICHMAAYSDSEPMRFNAAKYVVDRTMGPAERAPVNDGRRIWDDIYDQVTSEAESYLNK